MENTSKKHNAEDQSKVIYNTERVNLHDFGYAKSGNVQGDPDIYASYLERILNGDLVDENFRGLTEKDRNVKRDRIKELEKKQIEAEKENEKITAEIKNKEKQIEDHRAKLLKIREKRAEDNEELFQNTFSPFKFGVNVFILVALTLYLFFFYVSAAYKALYVDFEKIATNLAEGLSTGSIMPDPYELTEALRFNYLLLLVPFVFYAFGWAFHIFLEMKNKAKFILLGLLIAVTFTVDLLIALIIHNNTESAKELMGLASLKWSHNPTFYIILFLGFLVYIVWSILLDSLLREWKKREVTLNLKRILKHLRKDIKILSAKLLPVDEVKKEIERLTNEVNTLVQGNLKGYIDQFTTGWISYLAPENMKPVKTKCLGIKEDFEEKHKIQPGIVKVVK
ncbi:MAG: cell envelope integrity protein TolA [Bacteroidales bacterium]|nr:cell envelope integrity protein TolA [Bacteroidales bacterium]